jgi:hypothetical protein
MKKLKKLSNLLLLISMLSVFTSCKKDNTSPDSNENSENIDKGITKEEMLDYYIVTERKSGDKKLGVLYLTQENNSIQMTMHGKGYLRTKELTIANSTFSFDMDGNGKLVYTFTVEKGADGKLKLKSYQYTDNADANQGLAYAVMAKKTDAVPFENSTFKTGDLQLKFTTANNTNTLDWDIRSRQTGTKYYPPPLNQTLPVFGIAPEVSVPYYTLLNLGLKSNNDEFMGACVPNWKDSGIPSVLVERGSTIYLCTKQ